MEFKNLSAEVRWECQRVAAALGVKEWVQYSFFNDEYSRFSEEYARFTNGSEDINVSWYIRKSDAQLVHVAIGRGVNQRDFCQVSLNDSGGWFYELEPDYKELFACALYRLGIEDENVLAELNHPLTAHEKLELRLSLPREFWPQKWLDEEAVNS